MVALPVRRGARANDHLAIGPHLDGTELTVGQAVRDLDIDADADAELLGVAGFPSSPLLRAEGVVAGDLDGEVERPSVVAGVVVGAGRSRVRELVGTDQFGTPHLDGVHPELERETVDRPLDGGRRLGTAGA